MALITGSEHGVGVGCQSSCSLTDLIAAPVARGWVLGIFHAFCFFRFLAPHGLHVLGESWLPAKTKALANTHGITAGLANTSQTQLKDVGCVIKFTLQIRESRLSAQVSCSGMQVT